MIIIDGDMSTNDTTLLLANGAAWPRGRELLDGSQPECVPFEQALGHVCLGLAQAMARDGEGGHQVCRGARRRGGRGRRRPHSRPRHRRIYLAQSGRAGGRPQLGAYRLRAGYAGAALDPDRLEVTIGRVRVVEAGLATDYDQGAAAAEMQGKEARLGVHLHLGGGSATAWGCDLTPEYVRLNSDYTT